MDGKNKLCQQCIYIRSIIDLIIRFVIAAFVAYATYRTIKGIGVFLRENDFRVCFLFSELPTWKCFALIFSFFVAWAVILKCDMETYWGKDISGINSFVVACFFMAFIFQETATTNFISVALIFVAFFVFHQATIEIVKKRGKNGDADPSYISCLGDEQDLSEDKLDRGCLYERVVASIQKYCDSSSSVNGSVWLIQGIWGSGKTHLLSYIENKLAKSGRTQDNKKGKEYVFRNINLWQIRDEKELNEVACCMIEDALEISRSNSWLETICGFIHSAKEIDGRLSVANFILKKYIKKSSIDNDNFLKEIRASINNKIVVLFIDNVERADAKLILQVFPFLERIKIIPNVIAILSVSVDDLFLRCSCEHISKELILSNIVKIADQTVYLPSPDEQQTQRMFVELIQGKDRELGFPSYLSSYAEQKLVKFDTPRQICRAVDILATLEYQCFSDGSSVRNKKNVGATAALVMLAYSVELLKVFYPKEFKMIRKFLSSKGKEEMIWGYLEEYVKGDSDGGKTNRRGKFPEDMLFNSLIKSFDGRRVKDFYIVDAKQYVTKNYFPENRIELIIEIFDQGKYKSISEALAANVPEDLRPNNEVCLLAIAEYIERTINNSIQKTKAFKLIKVLLASPELLQKFNSHEITFNQEAFFSILYYCCSQKPNYWSNSSALSVVEKIVSMKELPSLSRIINSLLVDIEGKEEGALPILMSIKDRDMEENNVFYVKDLRKNEITESILRLMIKGYVFETLEEIIQSKGSPQHSVKVKDMVMYRIFDKSTNTEMIDLFRYAVSEWVNQSHADSVAYVVSFLRYFHYITAANTNLENIPCFSECSYRVYGPILDKMLQLLRSLRQSIIKEDLDSMSHEVDECVKMCKTNIQYFVSKGGEFGKLKMNQYYIGAELLNKWLMDNMLPILTSIRADFAE